MANIEGGMLDAIRSARTEAAPRMVYADWLESRGDPRAIFVRVDWAMRSLEPDDPRWRRGEDELSRAREQWDPEAERRDWFELIEEPGATRVEWQRGDPCLHGSARRSLRLHRERQDTRSPGWLRMLEAIDELAEAGATELKLFDMLEREQWADLVTLPAEIAKLGQLRQILAYGSALVRLPPELGALTELAHLVTYTSYGLHWYPYELTRCAKLSDSSLSTRTVYGNFKNRLSFPRLEPRADVDAIWPFERPSARCSVCDQAFDDRGHHRRWINLMVATDVMALLVNACSEDCIRALPKPGPNYVAEPHRGGRELEQPERT